MFLLFINKNPVYICFALSKSLLKVDIVNATKLLAHCSLCGGIYQNEGLTG